MPEKIDIWAELADKVYDYIAHHTFTEADIEKVIKEFVTKRIVMTYFTVKGSE